jgi:hypothetical protein
MFILQKLFRKLGSQKKEGELQLFLQTVQLEPEPGGRGSVASVQSEFRCQDVRTTRGSGITAPAGGKEDLCF